MHKTARFFSGSNRSDRRRTKGLPARGGGQHGEALRLSLAQSLTWSSLAG